MVRRDPTAGMGRIPEPQLMDSVQQVQAYAQADFEEPHQAYADALTGWLPLSTGGAGIDLGCGPGDITRRVARALPDWTFLGIDGGPNMLEWARRETSTQGLTERVRYEHHLLPSLDLPQGEFDLVFSNSLLHHLDDPCHLWETILHVGAAGAAVYIMDLRRPPDRESAHRLVKEYSANEPEILKVDFFNSLLAAYSMDEVRQQLQQTGLSHLEVVAVSDRHLVVRGQITP